MTVDAVNRPITIGIVSRPDSVGDLPRAICMYWLRKTLVPNIAMPTAMLAMTASTTVRRSNRLSGISGSLTRRSTAIAAETSATPRPTSANVCQESQSNCRAGRAGVVELALARAGRGVGRLLQPHERGEREGDAEVEAPAPADRVGDHAAE